MGKWIGVDLDGTLAYYDGAMGHNIGHPLKPMLARVKDWLASGVEVRIFTARAGDPSQLPHIRAWLQQQGLPELAITDRKDFGMVALYDDKAIRIQRNTGRICGACYRMRVGK